MRSWIIGASSGIGEALAFALAKEGEAIILSARRLDVLETLKNQLSGTGHHAVAMDVGSKESVDAATAQVFAQGPVDRILFMAGVYTPMQLGKLDISETTNLVQINLMGTLYVVEAVLPHLLQQKKGQLALCASVAGYRGLPGGQPYGATKAALINLAESLRIEQGKNLDIRVINPGFVTSRLTDKNDFAMPMKITPQQAAAAIVKGLKGSSFEIHFPKKFTLIMKFLRILPNFMYFWLMKNWK